MIIFYGSTRSTCASWKHVIPLSLVTALVYTGVDIVIDPFYLAKGMFRYLDVTENESFYGVPFSNYKGWIITVTATMIIFHSLELLTRFKSSSSTDSISSMPSKWSVIMVMMLQMARALYFYEQYKIPAMKLLSLYMILTPVLIAMAKLFCNSELKRSAPVGEEKKKV